ncbi:NAD-dependent succinate-semialdehyde dehydrogenase [Pseudomaricurvus alcaniphilus]|uniref:NAD-dependent succinate-semialdehyde dehydrogenase n=1 Tax=Pseudomaricurvus alcaniphilus TaxID=1166482 RepID=UPI00140A59FB|nr:NAD-dependent succinate-semialdehyde dehydrogenase [Pseudomaricurvus alcaniphilus]NHN39908.1 NAD-dependent succinate-semialdehyde dehydrogenase [Pseudomaricurvus alcaniphilus]
MKTPNPEDISLFRTAAFADGRWLTRGSRGVKPLHNPSTGALLGEIPRLGQEQVAEVIQAAEAAFQQWRLRPAKERAAIVRNWFDLIVEHADELAALIVLEEGKPFAEAKGEVAYAASFVEWFAEEAKRVKGDVMMAPESTRRIVTLKEPIGVCAAITPWNFPAAMITRKAAPAIAAGCTMVVKPAEQTPLTALALAELADRAGMPKGVFNVVTGEARVIGAELTGNPVVRKVTFTGSTEVGRILISQSAASIKKVSMELGGNAPFIVFDDADIDAAVTGLIATKYRNTGQACISANRVYVHDSVYDIFTEKLAATVNALIVGDGFEDGVQQGPLIDDAAVAKVKEHIEDAVAKGATIVAGGKAHAKGGRFFEPTVLANVNQDMKICHEETFGPVAPLIRFHTDAEVIACANDTEFGLAAYLFSADAQRIWRTAAALESGMVGINTGLISNEVAPFGGVKQSGLGREGSIYGIDEYLEIKYLAWEGAGL